MNVIEKVFPTEKELSVVSSCVRCSAENCSAIFKSTSNLNMHLVRHHKINGDELCKKYVERQFYCPSKVCIYGKDSKKYFKKLKYLKQHYLKVHAEKNFMCDKCGKRFATEAFQKMHAKNCGNTFSCICGHSYNSVEALLTHCKRKGHASVSSNSEQINMNTDTLDLGENFAQIKPERFICPKPSTDTLHPVHYIAAIALSELSTPCNLSRVVDKSVQTEFYESGLFKGLHKSFNSNNMEKKTNNSQQTQTTGKAKNVKISAETQTSNDFLKTKFRSPSKTVCAKKRKISMETQTKELLNIVVLTSNVETCNSEILFSENIKKNKKDAGFYRNEIMVDELFQSISSNYMKEDSTVPKIEEFSCSKKPFTKRDELLNKGIQIDLTVEKQDIYNSRSDLSLCAKEFEADLNELNTPHKKINNDNGNPYLVDSGTYNVFDINKLCNIETQTEIENYFAECNGDSSFTLCSTTETQTTDFDPLLYSNMYTQTCDEVDQLFNFNFVDIETQTAWPDLQC